MQTVITKIIDGHEVISGFDRCAMNPVETRAVVKVELAKTDEFKAVDEKKNQIGSMMKLAKAADEKVAATNSAADKEKHHTDKLGFLEQAKGYENELKGGLVAALKSKEKELLSQHAVYFEPKAGEYTKTDAEIDALRDVMTGLNGSGYVDLYGKTVADNRGTVYAMKSGTKWQVVEIGMLGIAIPKTAILYADLTAEQKKEVDLQVEIDRAAKLSTAEKATAKQYATEKALNDAAHLRSKLEIAGNADPLAESQAWYNERLAELDIIFT